MKKIKIKRKNKKKYIRFFFFSVGLPVLCIVFAFLLVFFLQKNHLISPLPISFKRIVQEKTSSMRLKEIEIALKAKNIAYKSLQISSDSAVLMTMISGEQVKLSQTKSIDTQISSLQLILSRLTIEGKRISSLDVRYDKPVVVFQ